MPAEGKPKIVEKMIHTKIQIQGYVQGVGFRYATRKIADQLGIKGFVRNMPDGSVYIEAEGTEKGVEDFIGWCRVGPSHAEIRSVSVQEGEMKNYKRFEVTF